MKDLIKEIEELQDRFIDNPSSLTTGRMDALGKVLDIMEQHNIITAPKSIKLSEILVRLENEFSEQCFFYNKDRKRIEVGTLSYWLASIYIKDNKIDLRDKDKFDYPKWLYELWIAGTEIIDDMEEKENEATNI